MLHHENHSEAVCQWRCGFTVHDKIRTRQCSNAADCSVLVFGGTILSHYLRMCLVHFRKWPNRKHLRTEMMYERIGDVSHVAR